MRDPDRQRSGRMRGAVTLGLGIFEVATQYDRMLNLKRRTACLQPLANCTKPEACR